MEIEDLGTTGGDSNTMSRFSDPCSLRRGVSRPDRHELGTHSDVDGTREPTSAQTERERETVGVPTGSQIGTVYRPLVLVQS